MMKRNSRYFVLAVLIVVLIGMGTPAHAGWVAVDKNGDTNLISKGMVKNKNPNRDEWSLMDVNAGSLAIVSDKNKAYTSGTIKEFCETMSGMRKQMMAGAGGRDKMMADMEQAMKGMDKKMKDMDPEQRKMIEQMMSRARSQMSGMQGKDKGKRKMPAAAVSVAEAGTGDVVAGFKTTHYRVSVKGRVAKEIWLTNDSSLMNDIKPYMNKFLQMSQEMTRCTSVGRRMMGRIDLESSENYQKLMEKGFPLREKDKRSGWVREVVKLEKKAIPDSEFALPKGYKKGFLYGVNAIPNGRTKTLISREERFEGMVFKTQCDRFAGPVFFNQGFAG